MNPLAATALRWGGAVVGLLLVVWFTVPALLNAVQASVQFGDDDEAAAIFEEADADDPEPAEEDEPADEPADEDEPADDDADGSGEQDAPGDGGGDGDEQTEAEVDGGGSVTGSSYEVQPGDTLFEIAEATLGDGHRWPEIAELNGLADGRDLRVGHVLEIPDS